MAKRAVAIFSIFILWFIFSFSLIFGSVFIFQELGSLKGSTALISSSSRNIFTSSNDDGVSKVLTSIDGEDVRPVLINRFLARHNSPMSGLGLRFVEVADKYGLDWKLLPAIAFQESNLGKKIPAGSFNPFGWAIYEGENSGIYFASWEKSIDIVAARLKADYINQGLGTPEDIVIKYTSRNSPSWVFAVKAAMEEISGFSY